MITLTQPPFSEEFIDEFQKSTKIIFGDAAEQDWLDSLKWRLNHMPDVTIGIARDDDQLIAFKAGYAIAHNRYYSWLGGVAPNYRRQGLAKRLMDQQHDWLRQQARFTLVETQVEQDNKAMIQLNMQLGMEISGFYIKGDKPYLIMQTYLK